MKTWIGGEKLTTQLGRSVTVLEEIGRGGQGIVYRVECAGKERALKWYMPGVFGKSERKKLFYDNLMSNVLAQAPSGAEGIFLWPYDVVGTWEDKSFGYIMDLIPPEYKEYSEYQGTQRFPDYRTRVDAMINIAQSFRVLHNAGYKYQDVNNGNVFIRPEDGNVLICDTDNIALGDRANGVLGKDRYMAPEVTALLKLPDQTTDRYSLAVLLFQLACKEHPLLGRSVLSMGMLSEKSQMEVFGENPVFIFDPDNDSNRPDEARQRHVLASWRGMPPEMQQLFEQAFSSEAMRYDPQTDRYGAQRVTELEWIEQLQHWRNALVACSCERHPEWYVDHIPMVCPRCGQQLPVAWMIDLGTRRIPAALGVRLRGMDLGYLGESTSFAPVAEVVSHPKYPDDPTRFGLRNLTDKPWVRLMPDGSRSKLDPGQAAVLKDQMIIAYAQGEKNRLRISRS